MRSPEAGGGPRTIFFSFVRHTCAVCPPLYACTGSLRPLSVSLLLLGCVRTKGNGGHTKAKSWQRLFFFFLLYSSTPNTSTRLHNAIPGVRTHAWLQKGMRRHTNTPCCLFPVDSNMLSACAQRQNKYRCTRARSLQWQTLPSPPSFRRSPRPWDGGAGPSVRPAAQRQKKRSADSLVCVFLPTFPRPFFPSCGLSSLSSPLGVFTNVACNVILHVCAHKACKSGT